MPWTDPTPAIGIDRPIRASTHLAIFENFAAMAAGAAGAPRIAIPQAVRTDVTDQSKALTPDGAGGVQWSDVLRLVAGGIHLDIDGDTGPTVIPPGPAIFLISGSIKNTSHRMILPAPSVAVAGHIVVVHIRQIGTFGGSTIAIEGGGSVATWRVGDTWQGLIGCTGDRWNVFLEQHTEKEDPGD